MGGFARGSTAATLAALLVLVFAPAPARGAEPFDNDELVAGPEFEGLPDKDSHSGVFLDLVGVGSSSVTHPGTFGILAAAASPTLRVAIFDGNAGGLWDQNLAENDAQAAARARRLRRRVRPPHRVPRLPDGGGGDRRLRERDAARGRADLSLTPSTGGGSSSTTGPQHPSAKVLFSGQYAYLLVVSYRPSTTSGGTVAPINGYKVAINAPFGLAPLSPGMTIVGGFIGGVVDSRNLLLALPGAPLGGHETSVSRDHYPDALEPDAGLNALCLNAPALLPAVRYPAPDPFVNRYDGTFDLKILLFPSPGETWPEFLDRLVLEEGDADDVDDASGLGPDGLAEPRQSRRPAGRRARVRRSPRRGPRQQRLPPAGGGLRPSRPGAPSSRSSTRTGCCA